MTDSNADISKLDDESAGRMAGADVVGGASVGSRVVSVVGGERQLDTQRSNNGLSGESAAIFSMIERAARDPNVDIEKMERLFQMQERAQATRARMAFDAAFAAMQPELPEIDKRGKIIIKEKGGDKIIQSTPYALWDDTNKLIKPILAKHGFGLSFRITQTDARITTTAILSHVDGHREDTSFSAGIDNTGSKNNVQGWGSSMTYGKRYAGTAILNITTKGEDDDGKAAGATVEVADEREVKLARVKALIKETKADEKWICTHHSIETIDDLAGSDLEQAIKGLEARKRKPANG